MIKIIKKKFKPRIKARIRKNRQIINKNINNLFKWVKGAELVELKKCNTQEDPVRPELSNDFRTGYGRKIYGVKYKGEIYAVMCFAYTNKIPILMSCQQCHVLDHCQRRRERSMASTRETMDGRDY